MISTLTTDLSLYHLHHASELHCIVVRNRERRKAFWFALLVTTLISIVVFNLALR